MLFLIFGCKSKISTTISKNEIVGDYLSRDGHQYRLLLTNEEFKYWNNLGYGAEFTRGQWIIQEDKIILNSKEQNHDESIVFSLSSGRWIIFQNKTFKIGDGSLKEIGGNKIKFLKK